MLIFLRIYTRVGRIFVMRGKRDSRYGKFVNIAMETFIKVFLAL